MDRLAENALSVSLHHVCEFSPSLSKKDKLRDVNGKRKKYMSEFALMPFKIGPEKGANGSILSSWNTSWKEVFRVQPWHSSNNYNADAADAAPLWRATSVSARRYVKHCNYRSPETLQTEKRCLLKTSKGSEFCRWIQSDNKKLSHW